VTPYKFLRRFRFLCWLKTLVVIQDSVGRYQCVGLKRANEIIGTTTEELVLKARQGNMSPWWWFSNFIIMYMFVLVDSVKIQTLPLVRIFLYTLLGWCLHLKIEVSFCFLYTIFCIVHVSLCQCTLYFILFPLVCVNKTTHSITMFGLLHYFQAFTSNLV